MIVYSFFSMSGAGNLDGVYIDYNADTNTVTAALNNGGIPKVSYDAYVPAKANGALIYTKSTNGVTVKLYWQPNFPFAVSQVTSDPDPAVPVISIDSITVTPESVQGLADGKAVITASGGTGPYLYSIGGVSYKTDNDFPGLAPGTYTAFVKTEVDPVTTKLFTIDAAAQDNPSTDPVIKDIIVLSGGEISIQNAYKRVEVLSEFGKVPGALYNGDFELWDGHNFNFWTRYGGLDFTRIQRTVTNSAGNQVSIENHALQFNKNANSERFLRSAPITVTKGDTIKMQYNVSKTDTTNNFVSNPGGGRPDIGSNSSVRKTYISTYYRFKFRVACVFSEIIKGVKTVIGAKYLYNVDYGSDYAWVDNLAFVGNLIDNRDGDLSNFTFNFNIPECPTNGEVYIDLHGFDKVQQQRTTLGGQVIETSGLTVLPELNPIAIDDILLSKSSKTIESDVIGLLSVSENLGYYTEKPEQIKLLFGDFYLNMAGTNTFGNMYAIKVAGVNSTGWYEYGTTNSPVAFGLALAKSILRAYQKPFRFWTGSLELRPLADGFSYLDTISFDVPNQRKFSGKVFTILGGDIDLKYNTMENVKLAEIFDKPGKSTDITVPNYPNSTPPVFVQDPTGNINNSGIFTDQFTQEFS